MTESQAIAKIEKALAELDEESRRRVLDWAHAKFDKPAAKAATVAPPAPRVAPPTPAPFQPFPAIQPWISPTRPHHGGMCACPECVPHVTIKCLRDRVATGDTINWGARTRLDVAGCAPLPGAILFGASEQLGGIASSGSSISFRN